MNEEFLIEMVTDCDHLCNKRIHFIVTLQNKLGKNIYIA
jgi:hypothetical protein